MNDDRLSAREHAELRELVIEGARHIKPASVRRMQIIAGVAAFALVGGISGGAIATAAWLGSEPAHPVATPTPSITEALTPTATPTPSPTPSPATPTPTRQSSRGVMPFGGECGNVLTDVEASAAAGLEMTRSDFRWLPGSFGVAGGIDCAWVSATSYLAATLHVYAYPDDVVPADVRAVTGTGCETTSDGMRVICDASGVQDGVWLLARATGNAGSITAAQVEVAYAAAAGRLAEHPLPEPARRTEGWWNVPECEALAVGIDVAGLGFDGMAVTDMGNGYSESGPHPVKIAAVVSGERACRLDFTSDAPPSYWSGAQVSVSLIPGGAVTFETVETAEHAEAVSVPGATSAMWVPGIDRYEGSWNVLVVSDGVNMLMLSEVGPNEDLEMLVGVAEAMLRELE